MSSKVTLLFSLCFLFYATKAFNITELLSQDPDFSTFNDYLTQTQLAAEINSRRSITVLVVENAALASLSTKPLEFVGNILSIHVLLDYYDVQRFQTLPSNTSIITTLFQTNGVCEGLEGFLNATDLGAGSVVIGSAVEGSTLVAKLVKSVAAEPYNISVLQISRVIAPNNIDKRSQPPKNSPPPRGSVPPGGTPTKPPNAAPKVPWLPGIAPPPGTPKMPWPPGAAPNNAWPPGVAPKNSWPPGTAPKNSWPPGSSPVGSPKNTRPPAATPKNPWPPGATPNQAPPSGSKNPTPPSTAPNNPWPPSTAPKNSRSPGAAPRNSWPPGNAPRNPPSPGATPKNSPAPTNAPRNSWSPAPSPGPVGPNPDTPSSATDSSPNSSNPTAEPPGKNSSAGMSPRLSFVAVMIIVICAFFQTSVI